jgi:alkylation response protein AidB-like acyl-CoA dehydrogenase
MCRKFADEELAPHAGKWDKDHRLPPEVIATMGELGLMGVA